MITDLPPNLIRHFEGNCKIPRSALCDLITQDKFTNVNLKLALIDDRCLTQNNNCFQTRQKSLPCGNNCLIHETSCVELCNVNTCIPRTLRCCPKYYKTKICKNASNTKFPPYCNICKPTNLHKCTKKGIRNDNCRTKQQCEYSCINCCKDENKKINIEICKEFEVQQCYPSTLLCEQEDKLCCKHKLRNHCEEKNYSCKYIPKEHKIYCRGTLCAKPSNNECEQQEKCQVCSFVATRCFEDSLESKSCELINKRDYCPTRHKNCNRNACHTNPDCQRECKIVNICDQCKKPKDCNLKECDEVAFTVVKVNPDICSESANGFLGTKTSEPGICSSVKVEHCICCSKLKRTISAEKSEKCIVKDGKCTEYINQSEKWGESCFNILNEIKDILLEKISSQSKDQLKAKQLFDFTNEKINKLLFKVKPLNSEDYIKQLENWGNKCTKVLRESIEKMEKNKCLCAYSKKVKSKKLLLKYSKSR